MFQIIAVNLLFGLYVSFRIYKGFFSRFKIYVVLPLVFIVVQLFFILRVISAIFNIIIPDTLINISFVFLALSIYLLLYFLLFDLLWVLRLRYAPISGNKTAISFIVLGLTLTTFAYGYYHQLDTKIKHYTVNISKPLKEPLLIALISDIHIGSGMTVDRLNKYVADINKENPDIILIAGDIIDNNLQDFHEEFRAPFRKFQAPLGVYAVLGNHEYYSGPIDQIIPALEDAGMKVLVDDTLYMEDKGFYLVGRDSLKKRVAGAEERKPLWELVKDFDKSKPVIVVDHIPMSIEDGKSSKIDIQLSGHTHGGQFFPITWIVSLMYPIGSGVLTDGDFNLVVSSGLGLWGPVVRVGSDSEILLLEVGY